MQTTPLYDAQATRAIDRIAIEQAGIPGLTLMERAGARSFAELVQHCPDVRSVGVLCGTGNNGGDGFVVARLASEAGLDVQLTVIGEPGRISGDARICFDAALATGLVPQGLSGDSVTADVLVDALLGTGLDRKVDGAMADAIAMMNACKRPVVALDVPSGLHSTTGRAQGETVRAAMTITFIGMKPGLFTADGPACCGNIVYADLDVPSSCYDTVPPCAVALHYEQARQAFPPRLATAHKGDFGHVLIVGGAPGFAGAGRLAAEAAARVGAGLVTLATHPQHAAVIAAQRPEIMCHGVKDAAALRRLCARANVIAVGPGLGQDVWAREMFAAARGEKKAQVLDADALNLLANDGDIRDDRIITPHPGEAARLLESTTAQIHENRFAAAAALVNRYGGVALLKGAGSIVFQARALPLIVRGGNPGMASGGMGDVLTGIIASLVAQGHDHAAAAVLGASLHAQAADWAAAEGGERGLLAADVIGQLRRAVNPSLA